MMKHTHTHEYAHSMNENLIKFNFSAGVAGEF